MKKKTIYTTYYNIVAGRFYSVEQRERILGLIASTECVKIPSMDFTKILKTTQYIDSLELDNIVDCKNYLLMLSFSDEAHSDKQKACCALLQCYEKTPSYSSLWEWQKSIMNASEENAWERAFFEYANGNDDNAVKEFEHLSETGHIPSMKFLSQILYDDKKYSEALYYIELLKKFYKERLHCEESEQIIYLFGNITQHLAQEKIVEVKEAVKYKKIINNNSKNTRQIGFSAQL